MNEKLKKLLPYAIVFVSFGLFMIIMVFVIDAFILPGLIHNKTTLKVPNLIGKSLDEAQVTIKENDLKLSNVIEQYNADIPSGTVINQVPKPDKLVKAGRRIYLTVSKGQETVTVPYLVGEPQRQARIKLMNTGLKAGDIRYEFNENYGPDTVISQSVRSGDKIRFGGSVDLIVSKGSEMQVQVPNLIQSDFSEVGSILDESGLILGAVTEKEGTGTFIPNTVISQSPEAGQLVRKGTPVNITITK